MAGVAPMAVWTFDGPDHYGYTILGELIGPYDSAAELRAELEDSNKDAARCERCERGYERGDLFWLSDELVCDACVPDDEYDAA